MTAFSGQGGFGGDFYQAYKHIYNPRAVAKLAFKNRPFLDKLTKKDVFEGDTYNHTIMYEDPQSGSADFATAIAQKQSSSQGTRMVMNRGRYYQAISILNEEIRASRSDAGSLLRKKSTETNGVLNAMGNRIDDQLHNGGGGVIASFTTTGSNATTTITLDTAQLGVRFGRNQFLQVASTNNTNGTVNTLLAAGASVKVLNVSRSATVTTLTVDTALNVAFPGIATTTQYFLLNKGDNLGFGINSFAGGVSGLKSWFPLVAPTAGDNFWGADRSVDAERLSACRYSALNGEKYESTFQNASAELALQGSNPSIVLCSFLDAAKYSQELGNKVRYSASDAGSTGFKPMEIQGLSSTMTLMPDPRVEPGLFYMLDMETLWLATLDAVPHLDESDGRPAAREGSTDGIEIRWRAWFQLVCDAPVKNLVGQFAP
jgi:hypothetical protein